MGKRYGYRLALTLYLLLWSWYTGVTGLAGSFAGLLFARLMVGLTEAGAYPTASALVRGWFPLPMRGRASSAVALGGRAGLVLALFLTPEFVENYGSRITLLGYAGVGLFAAVFFWLVARDTPNQHPWVKDKIDLLPYPLRAFKADVLPLRLFLTDRNLWLASVNQFGVNIGWAFLITKMSGYFTDYHHVVQADLGEISAMPALVGCGGMIFGGVLTDGLTKRFGLRLGRSLPLGGLPAVAMLAYLGCAITHDRWVAASLIGVMALSIDCANPAYWAFSQDVGRSHAAASLAWGNMFGQIGAGFSPLVLGEVQSAYGWPAVFVAGAIAFSLAALAGFLLDASRPVEQGQSVVGQPASKND